jgi:hypothetical protein
MWHEASFVKSTRLTKSYSNTNFILHEIYTPAYLQSSSILILYLKLRKPMTEQYGTSRFSSTHTMKIVLNSYNGPRQTMWRNGLSPEWMPSNWLYLAHNFMTSMHMTEDRGKKPCELLYILQQTLRLWLRLNEILNFKTRKFFLDDAV